MTGAAAGASFKTQAVAGRVVILNGASSAGKTSLPRAFYELRSARGELWCFGGIDQAINIIPNLFNHPEGYWFAETDDGLQVTSGPRGAQWWATYRRSIALWARSGFDVFVDEVAFDEEQVCDWGVALEGLDVTWVALHCELPELERREAARGDRDAGLARRQAAVVHAHPPYALHLDSTHTPPEELAEALDAFVGESSRRRLA